MSSRPLRHHRAALSLAVAAPAQPKTSAVFCSHCGEHAAADALARKASRVCGECGLGLLLQADADVAPPPGGAFIVVDSSLAVCAVSGAAERLLATREIAAVNRHITELLVPADAEAGAAQNLAVAITWAARGDHQSRSVTVRPSNTFGVRLQARIASCGPPRAALIAFR